MERFRSALGVGALCVLGLWPHAYVLPLWPESRDAVLWVGRGAPTNSGWLNWVFLSDHFIGWRPVTALSYSLDALVAGFAAWPYRVTDLGLHALCGVLVYLVFRSWQPTLPRWGGAVATAVLLAHPVSGLVVPHLARRAYPLSVAFGLTAMLLALHRPGRSALLLGALLFAAGANETAFLYFPVVAWLLHSRLEREVWRTRVGWMAVAVLVLVSLRFAVLGGLGGYRVAAGSRVGPIAGSLLEGLLGGAVLRSDVPGFPVWLTAVLAAVGCAGLLVLRKSAAEPTVVCTAWIALAVALISSQGVYFPRQVYAVLPPFALLVGIAMAQRRVTFVLCAAAVLVGVVWQSPVLRGPDPLQQAGWRAHDALMRDLVADLGGLPRSALVHAVIPAYRRFEPDALRARGPEEERFQGRQAAMWATMVTGVRFGGIALISAEPGEALLASLEGHAARIGGGHAVVVTEAMREDGDLVRPASIEPGSWLYAHDGKVGHLVRLTP